MSQENYIHYLNKAIENFKNKDYDASLSMLDEALQLNYDVPQLHYWLGKVYAQELTEERLNMAVISFTQAIQLKEDYTDAYFERGKLYLKLGQVNKAIADFEKALNLDPERREVYTYLAQALLEKGEKEKALDILKNITHKNSTEFHLQLGKALIETENYKDAIDHLNTVLAQDRYNVEAYELVSKAYEGMENYIDAIQFLEKASYINPSEDKYLKHIAVLFLKQADKEADKGNVKKSAKLISMAINVDYNVPLEEKHRNILKSAINQCITEGKNKEALSFIECIERIAENDDQILKLKKEAFKRLSLKEKIVKLITDIYTK